MPVVFLGCSTLPTPKHKTYEFPLENVYLGEPDRAYEKLGVVKTKVEWSTLSPDFEESKLCTNYFNKAAQDLLKRAQTEAKGDAVIQVRSVVVLLNGQVETYPRAECSDDGQEGQVLAQGLVVRWKKVGPQGFVKPKIDPSRIQTQ